MKYLNSVYNLIFEGVDSYQWKNISDNGKMIEYKFTDISDNKYKVAFTKNSYDMTYELTYYVHDKDYYSVSKVVNTNPYKILQTVFGDILNDFIKKKNPKKIVINGLSKDKERSYVSQRTKMYVRYLERNNINGYKLSHHGNRINLTKL